MFTQVARPRARSQELLNGERLPGTSSLHFFMDEYSILCAAEKSQESSSKSASSDVEVRAGQVDLRISISPESSWLIFAASVDLRKGFP